MRNHKSLIVLSGLTLLSLGYILADYNVCHPKLWENKSSRILCACNGSRYCGDIDVEFPEDPFQVYLYRTTKSGKRLEREELYEGQSYTGDADGESKIYVHLDQVHQNIKGWGGAFTDAFGENVMKLSEGLQRQLMESYFGKSGLQYNFGRVPIGGTDSSSRPYTYDDLEGDQKDFELKHWSLAKEDLEYKIPLILEAKNLAAKRGGGVSLFATPFSPPAWMKKNKSLVRGHLVKDQQTYKAYADYLIKFYEAYMEHGIAFSGATVQNEPFGSNSPLYSSNSLEMDNQETYDFITQHLGPALEKYGYNKKNFLLMIGDDSIGNVHEQVPNLIEKRDIRRFVNGLAFHSHKSRVFSNYKPLETLLDEYGHMFDFVMMSEAREGSSMMQKNVKPGSWKRAENYAETIINDLSHEVNAWIDWNMAVDMKGGPNWAKKNADSPILIDHANGQFYKQPMYYALAHFTRFFQRHSSLVKTTHKDTTLTSSIKTAAVHNKYTNHVITNVLNTSTKSKLIKMYLPEVPEFEKTLGLLQFVVEPNSITTVVLKL